MAYSFQSLLATILIRKVIWRFALTSVSSCQGFVGKTGTSVVKTTVKIIMEENSCQVNNGLLNIQLWCDPCGHYKCRKNVVNWREFGRMHVYGASGSFLRLLWFTLMWDYIRRTFWKSFLNVFICWFCMPLSMQVVPESQVSLGDSEKNTAPYCLSVSSTPVQVKDCF